MFGNRVNKNPELTAPDNISTNPKEKQVYITRFGLRLLKIKRPTSSKSWAFDVLIKEE